MADTLNSSNKKISAKSLLGGDKVEKYRQELIAEGKIPGTKLNATPEERRQAFNLYRKNKLDFKNFVEKVLQKKDSVTYSGVSKNVGGVKKLTSVGAIIKAPAKDLTLFEKKPEPEVEKPKGSFEEILKVLNSILATLQNQFKFDKKKGDDDRKDEERNKRSKRESALEAVKKISGKIIDKVVAPFKSIIDRIWNFIFYTLLGRAFTKLMDWLGDPKNAQKVQVLGRFLKDWWPALLGLYFMPFKGFMVKTLGRIALFSARFAAQKLIFTPGGAAAGLAALANEVTGQRKAAAVQAENKAKAQTGKGLGVRGTDTAIDKSPSVGDLGPTTPYGLLQGVAGGGLINSNTGMRISGAGPDTQLTALQPGEIVMNRAAVKRIGADKLLALNARYGGASANKPRFANNIQFAADGGMIGYGPGEVKAFMQVYNLARTHGAKFPELQAAIAMKETGWLKHMSGNNAFNQRGTNGKFLNYKTLEEAVKHNIRLWDKHREGMRNFSDFKDPISAWNANASAYAPPSENDTEKYKADVAHMINQMRPIYSQSTKAKQPQPQQQNIPKGNFFQNIFARFTGKKQGGGLIDTLSGILPGTGRVVAPKGKQWEGSGTTVQKFLGLTIPRSERYATYSPEDIRRYNELNKIRKLISGQSMYEGPSGRYEARMTQTVPTNESFVGDAFRNFGRNVKTVQGAANKQEKMMRQMGHTPDGYVNLSGQPIKKQSGGLIPQGPFTPLPSPGYVRPEGSFIPKPMFHLPGPIPGSKLPFGYDPFKGLIGGGLVKENTGRNIKGATADRQLTALQPGEYVLPVDTVNRLGVSLIDKLVALTDSNSSAAKLGKGRGRYVPGPLSRGNRGGMISLPPMTQSLGGGMGSPVSGTAIPSFSAVSPHGSVERSMNASIYGIVG